MWPEVIEMKTMTALANIWDLRQLFSSYRLPLPEQLVSDNGPQSTSTEFEAFLKSNGSYQAHMQCSIPPLFKQVGGKVCSDLLNES